MTGGSRIVHLNLRLNSKNTLMSIYFHSKGKVSSSEYSSNYPYGDYSSNQDLFCAIVCLGTKTKLDLC